MGSMILSSSETWCHVSPSSGSGNGKLTVTFDENTTGEDRTAVITVKSTVAGVPSKTITVVQRKQGTVVKRLAARPSSLSFESDSSGQTQTIAVQSNVTWTAVSTATNVCTVSPSSGTGNGTITVTSKGNTSTTEDITSAIHISADGVSAVDVHVTVKKKQVQPTPGNHTIILTITNTSGSSVSGDEIGIMFGGRYHPELKQTYPYYRVTHIPGTFSLANGSSTTLTLNLRAGSEYADWMADGDTYFATEANAPGADCKSSLAYYNNGVSYLMDALPATTQYVGGDSYSTTISRANVAWQANVPWVYTGGSPTPTIDYWSTGLPVVVINTGGREIPSPDENWLENVDIKIYLNRDTILYESDLLQFRGRGNSTWQREKKPYALKLNKKSDILGMPSHKRWCLLANYLDRTYMRNDIAFRLGKAAGLDWTPQGKYVELILNGQHKGNYYLSEQIKVSTNRVDIDEFSDYLLEIDSYYDEPFKFTSSVKGYFYNIKSPEEAPDVSSIESKINQLETLLYSGGSYETFIDFNSFAAYWFVNEFAGLIELRRTRNASDVGPHSMYCQYITGTDGNPDKLKMGPIWDFDLFTFQRSLPAAVNYNVPGLPTEITGDLDTDIANFQIYDKKIVMDVPYYDILFQNSTFRQLVKQKWATVKLLFYNIINTNIDENYNLLYKSESLDVAIWGMRGRGYHAPDGSMPFRDAATEMKNVANMRLNIMDSWINAL